MNHLSADRLLFATHNPAKVSELSRLLSPSKKIVSLTELGYNEEIPETGDTLEANALQKAKTVFDLFKLPCFSDDSGLFIEALNGEPGVHSAHYSGKRDYHINNQLVLDKLAGITNRQAYFKTIFCFIEAEGQTTYFEGVVHGIIAKESRGENGFGYDPIFIPDGYTKTFGELSAETKKTLSHRARATEKLIDFLRDKE